MKRRHFLQATVAVTAATGFAAPAKKPNIVLFYVDDLGWMDLACQGCGVCVVNCPVQAIALGGQAMPAWMAAG